MNCYAGLSLMKIKTCDQPKISSMNTIKTDLRLEQEMIKYLFQELFKIQVQLEKFIDDLSCFHNELRELIVTIDQMLELLMDMFEYQ